MHYNDQISPSVSVSLPSTAAAQQNRSDDSLACSKRNTGLSHNNALPVKASQKVSKHKKYQKNLSKNTNIHCSSPAYVDPEKWKEERRRNYLQKILAVSKNEAPSAPQPDSVVNLPSEDTLSDQPMEIPPVQSSPSSSISATQISTELSCSPGSNITGNVQISLPRRNPNELHSWLTSASLPGQTNVNAITKRRRQKDAFKTPNLNIAKCKPSLYNTLLSGISTDMAASSIRNIDYQIESEDSLVSDILHLLDG